jgi:hypothetical protein
MSVTIDLSGLVDFQRYLDDIPERARRAARLAVNQTAQRRAVPLARETIGAQVAFGETYLKDPSRLGITKPATEGDLTAIITARHRPTSLARFAPGAHFPTKPKEEIKVVIKPGAPKMTKRLFVVKLRAGFNSDAPTDNRGLAIRLAQGEKLDKSTAAVELAPNLYLLYGPSVNQVFNKVREDILEPVAEYLADEFIRQYERLGKE